MVGEDTLGLSTDITQHTVVIFMYKLIYVLITDVITAYLPRAAPYMYIFIQIVRAE